MTAAPFFLQNKLVTCDADITTIHLVNISKTEELYTLPPNLPSSFFQTHRHVHTHP